MKAQKTIKIPISDKTIKEKLEKLNRLTARNTFAFQLFLNKIIENDVTTVREAEKFRKGIESILGLSSFAQACRDKDFWMCKSYKRQHEEWKKITKLEKAVKRCKDERMCRLKHKLYRMKKRGPSLPTVNNKVPVMFDYRISLIEFYQAREFKLWFRISTLEKRIAILLHSYPYAERHLKEWKVKSFQIVWRSKLRRYEVHVVVEKEVIAKPKGNRKLRKINRWAFRDFAGTPKLKLMKHGNIAIIMGGDRLKPALNAALLKLRSTTGTSNALNTLTKVIETLTLQIPKFGLNKVPRKGAAVNHPELPMIAAKLEGESPVRKRVVHLL